LREEPSLQMKTLKIARLCSKEECDNQNRTDS
jgi:hypothetical protein